jgi:DNA-binding transcriptional LysR family regulator
MSVLEREVGMPLLERSGRSVRLTTAGERLVAHTERVLAVLEEAQADIDEVAKGVAGKLNTCAFPTAARALLVPALTRLREINPRLQVTLTDLEPEESIPALKTGQLDLVLTYEFDHLPEPEDPGVERHQLMTEPMFVALPTGHPRAAGPVSISDLKDEQWIVGRDGSTFLEVQIRVANEAGFQPKVDLQSNDYQVILAAVAAGVLRPEPGHRDASAGRPRGHAAHRGGHPSWQRAQPSHRSRAARAARVCRHVVGRSRGHRCEGHALTRS